MGKVKVINAPALATIQDLGRFGYRKFGIPQSGAMDPDRMERANRRVGNFEHSPVIEFAISPIKLRALEDTMVAVSGATLFLNNEAISSQFCLLKKDDLLETSIPKYVYGYVAFSGDIRAKKVYESVSTYLPAKFGGLDGESLKKESIIISDGLSNGFNEVKTQDAKAELVTTIRILKGPEWYLLQDFPDAKVYKVTASSNRAAVQCFGEKLTHERIEMRSSAVLPGTIQLPPNGIPIILMNDCQTTGGYPRIGAVLGVDLPKLAQLKPGWKFSFLTV